MTDGLIIIIILIKTPQVLISTNQVKLHIHFLLIMRKAILGDFNVNMALKILLSNLHVAKIQVDGHVCT